MRKCIYTTEQSTGVDLKRTALAASATPGRPRHALPCTWGAGAFAPLLVPLRGVCCSFLLVEGDGDCAASSASPRRWLCYVRLLKHLLSELYN